MSSLGGIYHFSGAPVDGRLLTALGEGLIARGPDGGNQAQSGSVGMVYRAFHTCRESRLERQPVVSPQGCLLVWDGRLDNREELLGLLSDELKNCQTDAAIVMAAYEKWGADCLQRLIGDFALSLWDPMTRTLLLARDPFGARTLYYHLNEERIIWSSLLRPLLSLAGTRLEVDDEYIAGYLTTATETERTPYRGIHSVPPGGVIVIQDGRERVQKFWSPDPWHEIRYRTDAEYEEHFRQVFHEAVRCRLRVDGPVWSELSGGLDSSSIVCVADQVLERGEAQASKLETVSYVFNESTTSDERTFIHCVEEKRGSRGHHLCEDDYRILADSADPVLTSIPNPLICFAERQRRLCELMREQGVRVLLSGLAGDNLLWSVAEASPELADLLLQLKPFLLHRRIKAWSQAQKKPYWQTLWRGAVWPILSQSLRAYCRSIWEVPGWFDPAFVARMSLRERMLGPSDVFGFRLPSGRQQASMLLSAIPAVSAGYHTDWGWIEMSYPFLDRPLVEFCLAIPCDQKTRPGETRSLQRRALRNVLPEKIAQRKSKRGPSEALCRALNREWPKLEHLFTDARVCARGYMDARSLREAIDRARHGQKAHSFEILKTLSLELWLRALERN